MDRRANLVAPTPTDRVHALGCQGSGGFDAVVGSSVGNARRVPSGGLGRRVSRHGLACFVESRGGRENALRSGLIAPRTIRWALRFRTLCGPRTGSSTSGSTRPGILRICSEGIRSACGLAASSISLGMSSTASSSRMSTIQFDISASRDRRAPSRPRAARYGKISSATHPSRRETPSTSTSAESSFVPETGVPMASANTRKSSNQLQPSENECTNINARRTL